MYEKEEEAPQSAPFKDTLKKISRGLYDIIETFVVAFAIVVFIYLVIASPHEVIGRSMEKSFWHGEYLLADKITIHFKDPQRGDVIIFKQTDTADYIKRVIGLPGDTIEVRDGSFWVNGKMLYELEYLDTGTYTEGGNFLSEGDVFTVPEGKLFVAGDNRSHSSDSRSFGTVNYDKIKGRAVLVYWPLSHLEIVSRPEYNKK